jgi:hypothetical protein
VYFFFEEGSDRVFQYTGDEFPPVVRGENFLDFLWYSIGGKASLVDYMSNESSPFDRYFRPKSFFIREHMVRQDAYEAAQSFLDSGIRLRHSEDIVIGSCKKFEKAWVFGYQTRRFLMEREFIASLVGNGPIVVPMSGKAPFLAGSGSPIEKQIAGFDL